MTDIVLILAIVMPFYGTWVIGRWLIQQRRRRNESLTEQSPQGKGKKKIKNKKARKKKR